MESTRKSLSTPTYWVYCTSLKASLHIDRSTVGQHGVEIFVRCALCNLLVLTGFHWCHSECNLCTFMFIQAWCLHFSVDWWLSANILADCKMQWICKLKDEYHCVLIWWTSFQYWPVMACRTGRCLQLYVQSLAPQHLSLLHEDATSSRPEKSLFTRLSHVWLCC